MKRFVGAVFGLILFCCSLIPAFAEPASIVTPGENASEEQIWPSVDCVLPQTGPNGPAKTITLSAAEFEEQGCPEGSSRFFVLHEDAEFDGTLGYPTPKPVDDVEP